MDIHTHDAGGRRQDMLCMPVGKLALWLATINPNKLRSDLREKVERRVWEQDRVFAGGVRQGPISFDAFVREPYPVGLGATDKIMRALLQGDAEALGLYTAESGIGQGARTDLLDNVQEVSEAPTGNTKEAGLRKLQKAAAEGNDEAAAQLAAVVAGHKKVHTACVEAGI